MNKKRIILVLILILIFFAIYYDQKFKPTGIEKLRETAKDQLGVLPPKAFTTDGCTLWPNSIFNNNFTDICVKHDMEYWKGGSAEDRKIADNEMRISANNKILFMGEVMYIGTRVFGHHLLPTPWRWGYGFEYPYNY